MTLLIVQLAQLSLFVQFLTAKTAALLTGGPCTSLLIFLAIIINSLPFGNNLSCVHVALFTVRNQLHHKIQLHCCNRLQWGNRLHIRNQFHIYTNYIVYNYFKSIPQVILINDYKFWVIVPALVTKFPFSKLVQCQCPENVNWIESIFWEIISLRLLG